MYYLKYYVGDGLAHIEEVPEDKVKSAVESVCRQDYEQVIPDERDDSGNYTDCLITVDDEENSALIWQNSDGARGYEVNIEALDVSENIKAAILETYDNYLPPCSLEELQRIGEQQMEHQQEAFPCPLISFIHEGAAVVNPFMDPTGRFPMDMKGAIRTYGGYNVINWCGHVLACARKKVDV